MTTTTAALLNALRDHYIKPGADRPGSVLLTEVTAPNRTNRADAIHVGLWASRGYTVDVHELKTSRADFQRELDNPAKAEAWWPHSSTLWIVAPSTAIAPPELLPPGWGLMVPGTRGRRFRVIVDAEHRQLQPSTALLAALLVSMETDQNNAIQSLRYELTERNRRDVAAIRREAASAADPTTRERLALLEKLEDCAGLRLGDWDWGDRATPEVLGAAIREAVTGIRAERKTEEALAQLEAEANRIRLRAAEIRNAMAGAPVPAGAP